MVRRAKTKIYESRGRHTLYLPKNLIEDSAFPLKVGKSIVASIEERRVVIEPLPRFEHVNTYDDHITVQDNELDQSVDIYLRADGSTYCGVCEATDCPHIDYALSVPEVGEALSRSGWRRKRH